MDAIASGKYQEEDLEGIYYFSRPNLVKGLEGKKITEVFAGNYYCYSLQKDTNELYSWGMGDNYVLGTRDDENVFEPVVVHPKMYHENQVHQVGTGAMHAVVLTTASQELGSTLPTLTSGDLLTSRADIIKTIKEEEEKKETDADD